MIINRIINIIITTCKALVVSCILADTVELKVLPLCSRSALRDSLLIKNIIITIDYYYHALQDSLLIRTDYLSNITIVVEIIALVTTIFRDRRVGYPDISSLCK